VKKTSLIFIFILTLSAFPQQELGFGCLGLVGGFGGYEMQNYQADGLNAYVNSINDYYSDSMLAPIDKFHAVKGYRFGLNLFRKSYSGIILTVKVFYSQLTEKNNATVNHANNKKSIQNVDVQFNNAGAGIDIGMNISKVISWKVVDGSFFLNIIKLNHSENTSGGVIDQATYSNPKSSFGYSLGSGFIVNLIKNYVSVEGTVSFTNLQVKEMKTSDGIPLYYYRSGTPVGTVINRGGLNFLLQLNLGFPL
jgi:hypothetical protein